MKILFLSQRVPFPPNKGDKVRSFNQIKLLSEKHQISLVCLTDNTLDIESANELKAYCRSVDVVLLSNLRSRIQSLLGLLSSKPLTLSYFLSGKVRALVDRKLRNEAYDLIFVYCSSMAQYVERVQHVPKVIDFVDVDSEKWHQYATHARFPMKWLYRTESRRLRKYEVLLAESFQRTFIVSQKESDDFRNLVCPQATVMPIPNGVDTNMFQPSREPYSPHSLVFTGAMDYFANVEAVLYFTREILPYIRKIIPAVTFHVVGGNPSKQIRMLSKICPNVIVTGYVDSVQPYIADAAVFVAPMTIARGVQNKILEAMAMGVPVVTTSLGFEGITATPGRDIFVEDLPERFANQVVQLMQNKDLRSAASENSRKTVETYYNWSKNLEKLEQALIGIIE